MCTGQRAVSESLNSGLDYFFRDVSAVFVRSNVFSVLLFLVWIMSTFVTGGLLSQCVCVCVSMHTHGLISPVVALLSRPYIQK